MSKKQDQKPGIEHVERSSADLLAESVAELKRLFPEAVAEGKVDFAKLRAVLGDEADDRPERYNFTWAGKRDAIRLLQTPSRATLVPAPKESVNFDSTNNVFIEGENLEVLKLLYKSYAGRVKMIYIDPPYNTGNDFIYPDNFTDPLDTYLKLTGQKDSEGNLLTSNPESSGRYHSAWLTMMYPRLFVAKQLLKEDGLIFVSIDDGEVANLRLTMNEIFGEENFIANVIWQKKYTRSNDARWFSDNHDHILVYGRSKECVSLNLQPRTEEQLASYSNPDNHPKGPWKATPLHAKSGRAQGFSYTFKNRVKWSPPRGTYPRYSRDTLARMDNNNEIWFGPDGKATPSRKTFLSEAKTGVTPVTIWMHEEVGHNHEANNELKALLGEGMFDNPKPTRLLGRMLELATSMDEGDIVFDFFAGSCTAAHAAITLNSEDGGNRRFLMVQLPEPTSKDSPPWNAGMKTIADLGKERIRRVIKELKDEAKGKLDLKDREVPEDLGFKVFKLAESNYRPWKGVEHKNGEAYAETMEIFADPLLPGWKPMNVIYEVALKEGYSLTCSVEHISPQRHEGTKKDHMADPSCLGAFVVENTVYRVTDADKGQSFLICLDDKIKASAVKALGLKKDDLFICRDVAITDEQAANLALQCKLKTI